METKSSTEIAGLFYEQNGGRDFILSDKQLKWLEGVRKEERDLMNDSVDCVPPANVKIDGRIVASYDVEYVDRQAGICKMTFRKFPFQRF